MICISCGCYDNTDHVTDNPHFLVVAMTITDHVTDNLHFLVIAMTVTDHVTDILHFFCGCSDNTDHVTDNLCAVHTSSICCACFGDSDHGTDDHCAVWFQLDDIFNFEEAGEGKEMETNAFGVRG